MSKFQNPQEAAAYIRECRSRVLDTLKSVVVGQDDVIEMLLVSLFANGHVLLIGVPGLAKTLLVSTLAKALDLKFSRIQFTPDLMPSDITGTNIIQEDPVSRQRNFQFLKGPIFANVILADEINRTPPKTQAALLQAMQEHEVTAAGQTFELVSPFWVLATQNPIEQEGTYPLPEAQLDRFLFSLIIQYPPVEAEIRMVMQTTAESAAEVKTVLTSSDILTLQKLVRNVIVDESIVSKAVRFVSSTRPGEVNAHELAKSYLRWGAGPRASQSLILGAKSRALLHGRLHVDLEDVRAVSKAVLRHRLLPNYHAESDGQTVDSIIEKLLTTL